MPSARADHQAGDVLLRIGAYAVFFFALVFLVNNFLTYWRDWPGLSLFFSHQGWWGFEAPRKPLEQGAVRQGWIQLSAYFLGIVIAIVLVVSRSGRGLREDSQTLSSVAAYIARWAFWSVLLVGIADMVISFLRIEGFLPALVGEDLTKNLGRPGYRGMYVHYPLLLLSLVIAYFVRSLGFIWLALLVVIAEFQIVIARFIFSYEQGFMGDLVRFWYASLFIFASAYTLIEEGHVRVDVIYTNFSRRGKALANAMGSLLLGLPICWVILTRGMAGKSSIINSPLLNFEISQTGFGMYVKYLMAGFLIVFALSMMAQFLSYFLSSVADLREEPVPDGAVTESSAQ